MDCLDWRLTQDLNLQRRRRPNGVPTWVYEERHKKSNQENQEKGSRGSVAPGYWLWRGSYLRVGNQGHYLLPSSVASMSQPKERASQE